MAALAVVLREHIEEEGLHVIVQRLMVQEELGQQAQILTVYCADISIHLEFRKYVFSLWLTYSVLTRHDEIKRGWLCLHAQRLLQSGLNSL